MNVESKFTSRRILVVDDEPQITRVLRTTLSAQGYDIRVANDGETALEIMKDWTPALVITDVGMPHMDGVELCRRIRMSSELPIIVLSVKEEERTKVQALDAGADDYVNKPVGMNELMARVRANLRRAPIADADKLIEAGDVVIDLDAYKVTVRSQELRLTPKEFEVLAYLVRNQGKAVTHRAILTAVWGSDSALQTEYLRVFINRLRKKIEADPESPRHILTEPHVGYRFQAETAR